MATLSSGEECPSTDYELLSTGKSRLCYRYYTTGCENNSSTCPFAHGGEDLRQPICYKKITSDMGPMPAFKFPERLLPGTTSFGKMKTDKRVCGLRIHTASFDSWLVNLMTGAIISFEDHESDPRMQYIKLEGTMEEVEVASHMVQDHLACFGPSLSPPPRDKSDSARDKWL